MNYLLRMHKKKVRGFVLPLTLVVCVIILTIATGISIILAKELYFSRVSRLSQVAYYAADSGLMCATTVDDQYIDPDTGAGIFQYNTLVTSQDVLTKINNARASQGLGVIALNDIACATAPVFDSTISDFSLAPFSRVDSAGNTEVGESSSFNMKMDLGNGEYRCAKVMVNKTATYRQIISRGFASCDTGLFYPVERAIVSTSESAGVAQAVASNAVVLTSGTTWTVPQNVTSIKVWAIGAGGGGAGAEPTTYSAGGGGAAGGIAYRVFTVNPGQAFAYSIGAGGQYGQYQGNGSNGGNTSITAPDGTTLWGYGGTGGYYAEALPGFPPGGSGIGGTDNTTGGTGRSVSLNEGGGGGGGLNGAAGAYGGGCAGGNGGQMTDYQGLFAVITSLGLSTTSAGTGGACSSGSQATSATGFGSGGGGASTFGGNGGDGAYGGGGGGAAGDGVSPFHGGTGGTGAIVISWQ